MSTCTYSSRLRAQVHVSRSTLSLRMTQCVASRLRSVRWKKLLGSAGIFFFKLMKTAQSWLMYKYIVMYECIMTCAKLRIQKCRITDGFILCFYKNTDHVFNYMLLMQTISITSGITQSTGKSKHNKHKSSSSTTNQESTTTTTKKSAAAYLRMRVRMQLHLKKRKNE